jgi:RNA polymerase sigma-70 factor (ECF subfamily)
MSSKAIAYFSVAPTSMNEVHGTALCAPVTDSALDATDQSQSGTPDPHLATVTEILEISDELLLEQVRQGAKEPLALLFRRHARSVRNVAHRILRDEAEADDLVQDVFIFIYRKASLFDASQGSARSWIIHVTYHRAFDRRRYLNSRHFYTSHELEDTALRMVDPKKEVPFYGRSIEGIFGKGLTAKFNARLTSEQRETIHLYFFEGYALKEIAQLTGRSLVNVRNHYYRGLERLRKYVLPEKTRSK